MRKILGLVLFALLATAPLANASAYTFTTSGTNSGQNIAAEAGFNFSATNLTLTLSNLTSPTSQTPQELVGFSWTLGGDASLTLTGIAPTAILNCAGDHTVPCAAGVGSFPYGWTATGAEALKAGGGSWHPYEIINADYTLPTSGNGQLANGAHNPFLVGPVVFTFTLTGTPGIPDDVTFYWGTTAYQTSGVCELDECTPPPPPPPPSVPEPASMLMLGTGLIGAGFFVRRKKS